MRSSLALLALLGGNAFAQPWIKHGGLHQKRDTFATTTVGNEVIIEDFVDVYVTLSPGEQPPSAQVTTSLAAPENLAVQAPAASPTSTSAVIQQKYAYPGRYSHWSGYHHGPSSSQASVVSQTPISIASSVTPLSTTPLSTTPVASPVQTSEPKPSSTIAVAPTSSTSAASSPVSPGTFWAESPMSPLAGGSGSKDVLTQANYWRNKWLNLGPFTWSSVLANDSYMTATQPTTYTTDSNGQPVPHDEGGAMVMGHHLYPGSSAQCIITGDDTTMNQDLTPFEVAFLGWLCEEPNDNIPCAQIGSGKPTTETGHADIIKGTVSQIGCYYMNSVGDSGYTGMWTCDFAES